MSTGSGGKPGSGSQPGRPAADTPQRLVVRSLDGGSSDSIMGANDTAVAMKQGHAETSVSGESMIGSAATPSAGTHQLADVIGATLGGRYLVTRKIGQGGMGAVYEATHTLIGKRVAVKVLLEKYAQREAIVKRLKQEAELASSVGNEHIIDITDFGTTEDGRTFVVMEFLDGESLAECLTREQQLPEQRILRIASQACSALAAAHAKGVVHRDIKPENLFLLKRKEQDFVKVVDFGISKSLRASGEEEETTRLTQTGMVLGTPLYMSPEQARGDDQLDHRVDVYALGVIMYEAAAGRVPFVGNNYLSVISQVLNEEPKALRELRPDLSEEFEAVVGKAMSKDVNERYASANDMLADITSLLDDPTRSTERAKITGPRRRSLSKKSDGSTRYVIWIAGLAVVVAAVVFSVTRLAGSSTKVPKDGSGSAAVVTPPPVTIDAGVAAVPIDAPPTEYLEVPITTKPTGAEIVCDGVSRGTSPGKIKVVKKDKDLECFARLDSFDDYPFKFNPLEPMPEGGFAFTLKKPPKGTPVQRTKPPDKKDPDAGSATVPRDKTGGELTGDPYAGSGTVPKK
ncbi:MAG: serine/threonine protein kinase [Myxococcales bacterium]|nr:serine/threonine protein kinase [Myxococcales bacterium]